MNCPHCLDQGWVWHIPGHKTYPTYCTPCQECNADESKPYPNSNIEWTVTVDNGSVPDWKDGTTCPYCTTGVLVRVEEGNGMRCNKCDYSFTWTP